MKQNQIEIKLLRLQNINPKIILTNEHGFIIECFVANNRACSNQFNYLSSQNTKDQSIEIQQFIKIHSYIDEDMDILIRHAQSQEILGFANIPFTQIKEENQGQENQLELLLDIFQCATIVYSLNNFQLDMNKQIIQQNDSEILKKVENKDGNLQNEENKIQDLENERNKLKFKTNITLTNRDVKDKPFL